MKKYFAGLLLLCCLPLACTSSDTDAAADIKDINLVDLKGQTHSLKAQQGKWLLINYWATWCPPCLKEIPHLIDAVQLLENVQVLGVSSENISPSRLKQFVEGQMINYPVIMLRGGQQDHVHKQAFLRKYPSPRGLPTTYLIDPQGRLVHRHEGAININQIEELIKR